MKYQLIQDLETNINILTNTLDNNNNWSTIVVLKSQLHQLKLELVVDKLTQYEYECTGIKSLKGLDTARIIKAINNSDSIVKLCLDLDIRADDYKDIANILLARIARS